MEIRLLPSHSKGSDESSLGIEDRYSWQDFRIDAIFGKEDSPIRRTSHPRPPGGHDLTEATCAHFHDSLRVPEVWIGFDKIIRGEDPKHLIARQIKRIARSDAKTADPVAAGIL